MSVVISHLSEKSQMTLAEVSREVDSFPSHAALDLQLVAQAYNANYRGCNPSSVAVKTRPDQTRRFGDLWRGVDLVLRHHACEHEVRFSLCSQLFGALAALEEQNFVQGAKGFFVFYMARYLRCEAPVPFQSRGAWKRWSKSRLIAFNTRNTHLWFSLLQCKRSCTPVSDNVVLQAYEKHRSQMSLPDPLSERPDVVEAVCAAMRGLLGDMNRSIAKLYKESPEQLINVDHHGSQSAAFLSKRSEGGQAGALRQSVFKHLRASYGRQGESSNFPEFPVLKRMEWSPSAMVPDRVLFPGLGERVPVASVAPSLSQYYEDPEIRHHFDRELLRDATLSLRAFSECGEHLLAPASMDSILFDTPSNLFYNAQVQAVLEPLKVRVISKGPASAYYLSKGLQQGMHTFLRQTSAFALVGRRECPTDLVFMDRGPEFDLWYSSDFVASTDNSSAILGNSILGAIIRGLGGEGSPLVEVWSGVLKPHLVSYPPVRTVDPKTGRRTKVQVEQVKQVNGQLMGSPESFPILCLINFALFLVSALGCDLSDEDSVEEFFKLVLLPGFFEVVSYYLRKCLMNGDDALFRSNKREIALLRSNGRFVGLSPSPGKVYEHWCYANINSLSIHAKPSRRVFEDEVPVIGHWRDESAHHELVSCQRYEFDVKSIPFLNSGLFFGQQKVLGRVGESDDDSLPEDAVGNAPLTSAIRTLLGGCLPGRQSDVLKQYLSLHATELAYETRGRNLFYHKSLGGMGVPLPAGFENRATWYQRNLALAIYVASRSQSSINQLPRNRDERPVTKGASSEPSPWHVVPERQTDYIDLFSKKRHRRQLDKLFDGRGAPPAKALYNGIIPVVRSDRETWSPTIVELAHMKASNSAFAAFRRSFKQKSASCHRVKVHDGLVKDLHVADEPYGLDGLFDYPDFAPIDAPDLT